MGDEMAYDQQTEMSTNMQSSAFNQNFASGQIN
jgi:hypothetical protein